jgi:hypothetical protein
MTHLDFYLTADPKAMSDAELGEALSALTICRRLMDGLPSGTPLLDAAFCKYARRDPVAVEFAHMAEVAA